MFQQPSVKHGIALLLKGEEGVGKNVWTNVMRSLMGDDKFLETSKPSTVLYGQFTSARRNKILICINEANGKDNHAHNDILKDMITSETFVCEAKGENAVMIRCYDRFIFTTNNDNPINLTPDSRRFVVFDVSSELKGNTAYFRELVAITADPHVRYEFYQHLMRLDISGMDWQNDRPKTLGMMRLMASNSPCEYRYVRDLLAEAQARGENLLTVGSDALFDGFVSWISQQHISKYETNRIKFGIRMAKIIEGCTSIKKTKSNRCAVYHFDVEVGMADLVKRGWVLSAGDDV